MKKLRINSETLLRWMIVLLVFCMCGVLMQIIAPEFPEHAAAVGILFFAMAAVLGVMIWRFRIVVRRERIAAAREQGLQESGQRAE